MVTIDATDSRSSCAHRLQALKRPMNIALPEGLTAETKTLSGWGRTNPVTADVVQPSSVEQLQELVPALQVEAVALR